jgi:GMP synthase (glutamine-hydrolysing)
VLDTTTDESLWGCHANYFLLGIQFHPEVTRTYARSKTTEMLKKADKTDTSNGTKLLKNFATDICGATQNWTMGNFVDQEIARIRMLVGPKAQVLGAVSGGVDSTVAAKLLHEAIGSRFTGIFVDHGFLRLSEREQVQKDLTVNDLYNSDDRKLKSA